MTRIRSLPALAGLLVLPALAMVGCSGEKPEATIAEAPGGTAAGAGPVVAASAKNAPWYAERLEALGFFVFPTPEPLPPFSVKTLAGADAGVDALAGKVALLNFWATWCPPCRTEMPSIQALHEKMRGAAFEIMAISVAEKPAVVRDFLTSSPYSFPMYLDESGEASAPFAGRGIPTTFVLDKQGRAIAAVIGARSYDGPEVVALFTELAERLP